MNFVYSKEVEKHKNKNLPVLALESTILAHGMPYPDNFNFAKKAESLCRKNGVAPATIAIIDGVVHIGLENKDLLLITNSKNIKKVSQREIGMSIIKKWTGATTVSATIKLACLANIPVFSTGGIGGVHKGVETSFDISEDLSALSKAPVIVVSAGAKAILDLKKTVEALESFGIPVLGYKTNDFPAFYSQGSGIKNITPVQSEKEIVDVFLTNKKFGLLTSTLVVNPIPKKDEIPSAKIRDVLNQATKEAGRLSISGKNLTPFLLQFVMDKTSNRSLLANKSLALNNVNLGIKIVKEVFKNKKNQ